MRRADGRLAASARERPPALAPLLVLVVLAVAGGCASGGGAADGSPSASVGPSLSPSPTGSQDPHALVCDRLDQLNRHLSDLESVPLRVAERDTLDDKFEEVNAAFLDLDEEDWQALGQALDKPMEELGYRLRGVELGVEDFRTTSNPAKAAKHVQAATADFTLAIYNVQVAAGCHPGPG